MRRDKFYSLVRLQELNLNYFEQIITFLYNNFRPVILLVTSVFAIHFAYKKIGNKVSVQYFFGGRRFTPPHIEEVILSNKKDKPINIYGIHAVFHNDLWLELDKYSPPKVLKPYESLSLSMSPYTSLSVGSDKYEPDFMNLEIYIESDDKVIKCDSLYRSNLLKKYKRVSVHTCSLNGFVYDESVAYILVYSMGDNLKTAFISKSGYIGNEWELTPEYLGKDVTENTILQMIKMNKFDSIFKSYVLYRVIYSGKLERIEISQCA